MKREGRDATLIAWSKMLLLALSTAEALAKEGIQAEVVDPRTLKPLDQETILRSVRKTGRVVIIEEGWRFGGVGAEIASLIYGQAFSSLDAPIERVTGYDVPMPYAKNLEAQALPTQERVIQAVKKALYLS